MSEESKDYLLRIIKEVMRRPADEQSVDDVLSLLIAIVEEL